MRVSIDLHQLFILMSNFGCEQQNPSWISLVYNGLRTVLVVHVEPHEQPNSKDGFDTKTWREWIQNGVADLLILHTVSFTQKIAYYL